MTGSLRLKCPRQNPRICGHEWTYTPKKPGVWVTSCPKCKTTVIINKASKRRKAKQ
jgi:hypothetical protein